MKNGFRKIANVFLYRMFLSMVFFCAVLFDASPVSEDFSAHTLGGIEGVPMQASLLRVCRDHRGVWDRRACPKGQEKLDVMYKKDNQITNDELKMMLASNCHLEKSSII